MLASLYPVRDMRLSGQVIHTGKSSMEVAVRMQALDKNGGEETIMLGNYRYFIWRFTSDITPYHHQGVSAWCAEMRARTVPLQSTPSY